MSSKRHQRSFRKGYKVQKIKEGCFNCFYVFERVEYDSCNEYYCLEDATCERPCCCSVAMSRDNDKKHVDYYDPFDKKSREKTEKWSEWAKENRVDKYGICKKYVKDEHKGDNSGE